MSELNAFIRDIFEKKKSRNPKFSKRAFAMQCGLSIGQLNDYFTDRRNISEKTALKVAEKIMIDGADRIRFETLINRKKLKNSFSELDINKFEVVAEPIHFAFMSAIDIPGNENSIDLIAKELGVSKEKVYNVIERLSAVGMVKVDENGFHPTNLGVITPEDTPSSVIQSSHIISLNRICDNIARVPVEKREVCSATVAIDPAKLPQAKKRIRKFLQSLGTYLESGTKKEVYELNIQLFPWKT